MKYYIIAGERSGDLHGSNLIKNIKKNDSEAIVRGFGGDLMEEAGMDLVVHYQELAFMGLIEVIINIRKISSFLRKCKRDINDYQPDVIVLIDYAGFNLQIAKFASKRGFKVFYYISPKVWAWKTSRVRNIKRYVDKVYVILPFEVDFFSKHDVNSTYVGNPVVNAVNDHEVNSNFKVLLYV